MAEWIYSILFATTASAPAQTPEEQPADTLPQSVKFDILVKQPEPDCEEQTGDEIVVCGKVEEEEQYRVRPIPNAEKYEAEEGLPKAEFGIAENATMAVEADAVGLPQGGQSNRMMARLKIGF